MPIFRMFIFSVLIGCLIGCSSSQKNDTENVEKTEKQSKAETPNKSMKSAKSTKSTPKKEEVKKDVEWVIILTMRNVEEDKDRAKFQEAITKKWGEGKSHVVLENDDFMSHMKDYTGAKVITAEILYNYGEYEFTVRTEKVDKDQNGFIILVPFDEGPNAAEPVRGIESPERMLKEIQFFK